MSTPWQYCPWFQNSNVFDYFKGSRKHDISLLFPPQPQSNKGSPEPIAKMVRGEMGPLEMAENKSVTWVIYPPYVELNNRNLNIIIYIYIYMFFYTWNPKDPFFDWKGLLLGSWPKQKIEIIWALHFQLVTLPTFYGTCHDLPRHMPAQKLPNWLHWPISKRRLTQATASCRWERPSPGQTDLLPYLARRHRPRNNKETGIKAAQVEHMMVLYLIPLSIIYMINLPETKSLDLFFACAY